MLSGHGRSPDDEPDDFDDLDEGDDAERDGSSGDDDDDEDEEDEDEEGIESFADDFDGEESDDEDGEEADDELPASTVFVATATPLEVSVAPLPDDRAPDGVCLAARIDGRLVARCAMPGESIERLVALKLFEEPVLVGLLAFEGEPGIQGRLVALVPAARLTESSEPDEPWKASVPSFEDAERESASEEGDGSGLAAILLGHIVRFSSDRKHPEDLAQEAVDILQRVVAGAPMPDAASKAIDDLLDSL
ncbi:MAG TPA: hypothetical protein VFN39_07940 [Gemmatimonadaceae bacterium]|nr:hypothetical protein [Gemmatimonadaceae bacterium]